MNATADPQARRTRQEALAERKAESCERTPMQGGHNDDDNYTIIKNKKPTLVMGTLEENDED